MFKTILTISLWAIVFLLSGAQGWSTDMEDRFIDPDFNTSKSIFIDVKDVSLINVLKIFSQQSGLSFIASPDVADKKITLYLNKIPLDQALETVLDANGLTYQMQHDTNVFFVTAKPATAKNLITKVYQLKYATVYSSPLNSTISTASPDFTNSSSTGATPSTGAASSTGGSSSAAGGATSSGGLEAVIKNSLSPDGKIVEDVRTNSLIITDVPAQFEIIDTTVAKLDVPIPQILIEVEMVDVSKSTADQLGVSYGATPLTFSGATNPTGWPFWRNIPASALSASTSSSSSSSTSSSNSSTAPTIPTLGSISASGLTATLNFLTTNTDARTLARPRILTLNNQTALIQISTDQVASFTQTVTTSTTGPPIVTYSPQRYTTGVILKVTPQANLMTREVTMAVSPRDIDLIQSQVQPPSPSTNGTYFDPQTRGSDSILKLKDGQSMMIGGLMNNQTTNIVTKLPFLGDLPFIGAAFRSKNLTKSERELIIFLTPHIIDDTNQSALKGQGSSISAEAALEIQDATDRTQEISNSLNTYEMKQDSHP